MSPPRKLLVTLLALALLLPPTFPVVYAGYQVHPELDVDKFITYFYKEAQPVVFPQVFTIKFSGEYDHLVNSWWGPFDDPASYRYEVRSREYYFQNPNLPQIVEIGDGRVLLTYFATVSVVPYATKTWWGQMEEHAKVSTTVYIYGRIDRPPSTPGKVDLGGLIASLLGSNAIVLYYQATVERVEPGQATYTVNGNFELILKGLYLNFYRLRVESINAYATGGQPVGSYEKEGYIMIAPVGEIWAYLCLDGEPGHQLNGRLQYSNQYGTFETDVALSSGSCTSAVISNAALMPGKYAGNSSLTLCFRSGAFDLYIAGEADIRGALISASIPFAIVEVTDSDSGKDWKLHIYMGVNYISHEYYMPGTVSATGILRIGGNTLSFTCDQASFTDPGTYICEQSFGDLGLDPFKVTEASVNITVRLEVGGITHKDTTTINASLITPATVQGVVRDLYFYVTQIGLGLMVGSILLLVFLLLGSFLGLRPPLDIHIALQILVIATVFTVFVMLLPYGYWLLLRGVSSFPEFQEELSRALGDPNVILGRSPHEAMAMMFSFYDRLLADIRIHYRVWVEEEIKGALQIRMIELGIFLGALLALAIVLIISGNSPVAAGPFAAIVGFLGSVISMLLMQFPLIGVLLAFISLTDFIITVTAVLFLSVLVVGAILALIPFGTIRRYAEDMLGAGVLYLLGVPAFAPIIYCIYSYILRQVDQVIASMISGKGSFWVSLGIVAAKIFIPIETFMRITAFITIATLATTMVTLLHAYLLTRTGLMGAIGEGLLRLARR